VAELPQNVKGTSDILPPEVAKWQFVERRRARILDAFAYRELRTPILEYTPLFLRTVGETTEVVEKQMYTFADRDGSSVTMRPEGTASAVRAYIARSQWNREPVTRWYYLGPCSATSAPSAAACASSTRLAPRSSGSPGRRSTRRCSPCWWRCSTSWASRPRISRSR